MTEVEKLEQRRRYVARTADWHAVKDATLTLEQEVEVHRQAHLAAFGTEPPAGERLVDFRRILQAQEFILSGMSTIEAECEAMGRSWEKVKAQVEAERAATAAAGLTLAHPVPQFVQRGLQPRQVRRRQR